MQQEGLRAAAIRVLRRGGRPWRGRDLSARDERCEGATSQVCMGGGPHGRPFLRRNSGGGHMVTAVPRSWWAVLLIVPAVAGCLVDDSGKQIGGSGGNASTGGGGSGGSGGSGGGGAAGSGGAGGIVPQCTVDPDCADDPSICLSPSCQ